jgi:uncharacterized membrane protein YebE (DUF533 family)
MVSAFETKKLKALCFLYFTFSHTTDDDLSRDEMKTIAGTLREWSRASSLEDIGALLRTTMDAYKAIPGKADRIREANEHAKWLAENESYDSLHKIVSQLTAIANADGKLVESERTFIIATANTLGVPVPEELLSS